MADSREPISPDISSPKDNLNLEPAKPVESDFSDPENYKFAMEEYTRKLNVYVARKEWRRSIKQGEEDTKEAAEERKKHIFHCFDDLNVPKLEAFCPIKEGEEVYGNSAQREGFKPSLVSAWIFGNPKTHFKTDVDTGILYFYNGKSWIANAEPYLEYLVNKILEKEARVSHYKNIEFALKARTYQKIEFSQKIACLNGLLDVETLEFSEYGEKTRKEMTFYTIPTNYDPKAQCPNWEAFTNQVVTPDDKATLEEWSGYCLLPNYSFHKIMWIVGSGRNGKGVWQRTIENILGQDSVSNVGLEEFDGSHRFAMYLLHGKLVNFCSEPRTNKELQTTLLKYATGQDTIEAEIKNKQRRLSFKNCAKITVLANKFPRCTDQTTAFTERRLFLKFPNEFIGKEQIQNIELNWLVKNDERSGILNWMLKGLQRLLAQGYFTTSRTQEETELEFLRASDSISAFISETAIFGKAYETTRSEAKEAYNNYCEIYGIEPENEKKLAGKLRETPHVKDGKIRVQGNQERAWIGISFKEVTETSETRAKLSDFGTDGTLGTGKINSYNPSNNQNIGELENGVPTVPSGPTLEPNERSPGEDRKTKPIWYVKTIPQGEQCECQQFNVTKELVTPTHDVIKRCEECYQKLRKEFSAEWKPAYPDMANPVEDA